MLPDERFGSSISALQAAKGCYVILQFVVAIGSLTGVGVAGRAFDRLSITDVDVVGG